MTPGPIDTGEFDLEALMVRVSFAVERIGAKRVALDSLESVFPAFSTKPNLVRSELLRLLSWLKGQGLTTVITGERDEDTLIRHGMEEYLSDCVVLLDHRVVDEIATRRLRNLKYRGSTHGRNEYPFLIGPDGLEVLTGSARAAAESAELSEAMELRRQAVASRVASLWADFEAEESQTQRLIQATSKRQDALRRSRQEQGRQRTVKPEDRP
jgi:KaiC/GvpD/RAD55 family RecA-like ATPase